MSSYYGGDIGEGTFEAAGNWLAVGKGTPGGNKHVERDETRGRFYIAHGGCTRKYDVRKS